MRKHFIMVMLAALLITCASCAATIRPEEPDQPTIRELKDKIAALESLIQENQDKMGAAHDLADAARKLGCSEDHFTIVYAKEEWNRYAILRDQYQTQLTLFQEELEERVWWTDEDIEMLTRLVWYEAGSNSISDRQQQLTVCVAVNRMFSTYRNFANYNTIAEVLTQPGQYDSKYVYGSTPTDIPERCRENVIRALEGECICPENVLYQSNYPNLGVGTYEFHWSGYSWSYFNYAYWE